MPHDVLTRCSARRSRLPDKLPGRGRPRRPATVGPEPPLRPHHQLEGQCRCGRSTEGRLRPWPRLVGADHCEGMWLPVDRVAARCDQAEQSDPSCDEWRGCTRTCAGGLRCASDDPGRLGATDRTADAVLALVGIVLALVDIVILPGDDRCVRERGWEAPATRPRVMALSPSARMSLKLRIFCLLLMSVQPVCRLAA
jgi:hypothetical protein